MELQFGTKLNVVEFLNGASKETIEKVQDGKIVHSFVRRTEVHKIDAQPDVLARFIKLLDLVNSNPKYFDLEFKYSNNKVYCSWSERT